LERKKSLLLWDGKKILKDIKIFSWKMNYVEIKSFDIGHYEFV